MGWIAILIALWLFSQNKGSIIGTRETIFPSVPRIRIDWNWRTTRAELDVSKQWIEGDRPKPGGGFEVIRVHGNDGRYGKKWTRQVDAVVVHLLKEAELAGMVVPGPSSPNYGYLVIQQYDEGLLFISPGTLQKIAALVAAVMSGNYWAAVVIVASEFEVPLPADPPIEAPK